MLQQPCFNFQASAVADEVAIFPNHAMTGNDNGNGILVVGKSNRANGLDVARADRELFVRYCPSVCNINEVVPYIFMKVRAHWIEFHGEEFPSLEEIFLQLTETLLEHGGDDLLLSDF